MPRYERRRGSTRDLWEIEVTGCTWNIRYGQEGKPLETYTRDYPTPTRATREAKALIAQRIADGYVLVDETPLIAPPAPASELELQLRANPDDEALALVLADWLQARGDPRGRLIAVQHRLAQCTDDRERAALLDEELAIVRDHSRALLGGLARYNRRVVTCRWRRGFLEEIRLAADEDATAVDMLGELCTLPDAWFVESIRIGMPRRGGESDFSAAVEALVENAARLPRLRRLVVGDFVFPDESELSWTSLGDISPLYAAYPRLEQLILQGGTMDLGTIDLPALRHFEVRTGGLAARDVQAIARAHWPALERLVVWLGDENYGAGGELADLEPILDGVHPQLRHLGLCNAAFTDDICRALPASKVAERLETLDLSLGVMTDAGAAALVAVPEPFPELRRLDVSDNYLTEDGLALLRGLGVEVTSTRQRWADDELGRYVAVGE